MKGMNGLGAALTLLLAGAAAAQPPVPDWRHLEMAHEQDGGVQTARARMLAALPIGSSMDTALRSLSTVGATCKPRRGAPDVQRCLIHQYSLLDGAADDVRWTVVISAAKGRVDSLRLDRYVDRHGTAG